MAIYQSVATRREAGTDLTAAVDAELAAFQAAGGRFLPGFGHRFHQVDPRVPRLLEMVDVFAEKGAVGGKIAAIGRCLEDRLAEHKGKRIPMNIDGATAVIYAELGFPAPLARGPFCLSRSVGILAHAWEESQSGLRNKGPMPRDRLWR